MTEKQAGYIRMMVRQAKNKKHQITILSELMLLSKADIIAALDPEEREILRPKKTVEQKSLPKHYASKETKRKAVLDAKSGMSFAAVGRKYGFCTQTISGWVKSA